jgi:hypothetical protein
LPKQRSQLELLLEKPHWSVEDGNWLLNYLENSDGCELEQLMEQYFQQELDEAKPMPAAISSGLLERIETGIRYNS